MVDFEMYAKALADKARKASGILADVEVAHKDLALRKMAENIRANVNLIKEANAQDLEAGRNAGLSSAMLDRLTLTDKRIEAMAVSIDQIAAQTDPVGERITGYLRPNGLLIEKVRVPIGVILVIYESRPNVTADAAALCIRSSNAVILRGGKEAINTNKVIANLLREAVGAAALPVDVIQLVEYTDRSVVNHLLKLNDYIDLVIPRGGRGLIEAVTEQSRIPVIKHYAGNCHIYVDKSCPYKMAEEIVINAKCQRPGVCNAVETVLFHKDIAEEFLPKICQRLYERGVRIRGCSRTCELFDRAEKATEEDWFTEYLDLILAVKVVDSIDEAIEHINHYGSHHTDAILTTDITAADKFLKKVDSSSVMVNASTRFSDGFEYGLGAEIGISTDKLHARGPMGAADLTTYKYIVYGKGQIRT